ncbi:MAG: hypothetical protein ACLQVI_27825 [Polyangiaceae bacterium]
MTSGLGVIVDGEAMPREQAREFWARFSAYMEEHKGDLAGFAKQEGFASVHPAMENGAAVLLVSRTSAQRPYAPVRPPASGGAARGGSLDHQASSRDPSGRGGRRRKGSKGRK